MKSYGFTLHRQSKHLIWRDANGVQIVTAKTISDKRAIDNIKTTIALARSKHYTSLQKHP